MIVVLRIQKNKSIMIWQVMLWKRMRVVQMSKIPTIQNNNNQQQQQQENDDDDEKAQELVHHMLTTVQQFVSSPPDSWKGALDQQRHSLTTKLRELQSKPNKVTAVQQGVRVMRQVGEAVAKKTQDFTTTVSAPLRKPSSDKVPMVRVGRIVITDLRIFSREEAHASTIEYIVIGRMEETNLD